MSTEKTPKNAPKYYCEKCHFGCNKSSDYKRHLDTKNINQQKINKSTRKTPKNTEQLCM